MYYTVLNQKFNNIPNVYILILPVKISVLTRQFPILSAMDKFIEFPGANFSFVSYQNQRF